MDSTNFLKSYSSDKSINERYDMQIEIGIHPSL